MNSICISGHIATAPNFSEHENDVKRCRFSLANDQWYGGEKSTGFYWVTAWGKRAEAIRDLCDVGTAIYISGRLEQYRYENETGQMQYENSIILESFEISNRPLSDSSPELPSSQGESAA